MWKLIPAMPIAWTLAAAPGERTPFTQAEVTAAVEQALVRRFNGRAVVLRGLTIKPSTRASGFVACGEVFAHGKVKGDGFQRFFAVVPGGVAMLDLDGSSLIDTYWRLNGCG